MPLFLMMGGELAIAFLIARIGLWILGGRRAADPTPPPGPGRPKLIEGGAGEAAAAPPAAVGLREAA